MSIEQQSSYFRAANTAMSSFPEEISARNTDPFDMDFRSVKTEEDALLARGNGGDASIMTLIQSIFQKC